MRCKAGDVVRIEESRPISKRKRWVVLGGVPTRRSSAPRESRAGGARRSRVSQRRGRVTP